MTGFAGTPGPARRGDSGSDPWPEADEPPGGEGGWRTGPDEDWQTGPQPAVDYGPPAPGQPGPGQSRTRSNSGGWEWLSEPSRPHRPSHPQPAGRPAPLPPAPPHPAHYQPPVPPRQAGPASSPQPSHQPPPHQVGPASSPQPSHQPPPPQFGAAHQPAAWPGGLPASPVVPTSPAIPASLETSRPAPSPPATSATPATAAVPVSLEPPRPARSRPGQRGAQATATARPVSDTDEAWALLGYLGMPFISVLAPLFVYAVRRRSPFVRRHAAQALNMSITIVLYDVCVLILGGVLALDAVSVALLVAGPIGLALWLIALFYLARAGVRASLGEFYQVPRWLCATIAR